MDKFFHDGVDPVFTYSCNSSAAASLAQLTPVRSDLLEIAWNILENGQHLGIPEKLFNSKTVEIESVIPATDLAPIVLSYCRSLGLHISIVLSPTLLALATVSPHRITLNPNSSLPVSLVPGFLAHEIGTHLLRMRNEQKQPWYKNKRGWKNPLNTEEGLAAINTAIAGVMNMEETQTACQINESLLLYSPALNYIAASSSVTEAFSRIYAKLAPFIPCPVKRFKLCARAKRGVLNTAEPGGCSLDQAYLVGAVEILSTGNFLDIRDLYLGQISIPDVGKAKRMAKAGILLPEFLKGLEFKEYMKWFAKVREVNGIPSALLRLNRKRTLKCSRNPN